VELTRAPRNTNRRTVKIGCTLMLEVDLRTSASVCDLCDGDGDTDVKRE